MSDNPSHPVDFPGRRRDTHPWSLRMIVEQMTGKRLEEFQEAEPIFPRTFEIEAPFFGSPSFPTPLSSSRAPEENRSGIPGVGTFPSNPGRERPAETERKCLSNLLSQVGLLSGPALAYLAHTVQRERRERGARKEARGRRHPASRARRAPSAR